MSTETFRGQPEPVPAPGPRGAPRSWWWAAGALAAAGVVSLAAVLVGDGDGPDRVAPPAASVAPSSSPSRAPTTTAPTAVPTQPAPPAVDRSPAVWPVAGAAGLSDPVAAARAFAVDYLGFTDPVVGAFAQGDSRSGEVEVRPRASGPATTVLLRQLSGEDTWSVLGAATEHVDVTRPEAGATITSPVLVQGSAFAFEGNVLVQVRQDGSDEPLGQAPVTGGGDVARPFSGTIPFRTPTATYGALVLLTESAEDGSVWEAAVLRVRLAAGDGTAAPVACTVPQAPPPLSGSMLVRAYFTCDPTSQAVPGPVAVERAVPQRPAVLAASLGVLLAGPSAQERAAGLTSWFSGATDGMLHGVLLDEGHAVVDLGDLPSVIPGASTSAGSALLLSELDATVFQFATVRSAEYRLDGSCTAFTEWLQTGGCEPRTR